MTRNQRPVPIREGIMLFLVLATVIAIREGYISNGNWYWALMITLPLLAHHHFRGL